MGVPVVTGSGARRRELGRCLRAHRDLVAPERVGLPVGGRRRAPGLRREEVAALAGVGLTWYTWLEQGRVTASDEVLDAVGRVFGIDDAGRAHLRSLSRPAPAGPAPDPLELRPLLDGWPSDPAVLLDERLDVLAANDAWRDVWGGPGAHVLWRLAVDGARPGRVGDPVPLVAALARRFRMVSDREPADPRTAAVRASVQAAAPGYRPYLECRGVGAFGRPAVRLDGTPRTAHLVSDAGAAGPSPSVLVLLPDTRAG